MIRRRPGLRYSLPVRTWPNRRAASGAGPRPDALSCQQRDAHSSHQDGPAALIASPRHRQRRPAEALGHASMKMTMRYAHLSPAFSRRKSASSTRRRPLRRRRQRARNQKGQEKGNVPRTAINADQKCLFCLRRLAPRAGLEPATLRLTAGCSAIELPRIERAETLGKERSV